MTNFPDHGVLKHGPFMEPVVQIRLYDIFKKYSYMLLGVAILLSYVALVQYLRFSNVNSLKAKYGFSDDSRSYEHMTVEQAQEVERNLAEWDFPFLFEFGWIIEFLKTASAPCISKALIETGHFTNVDPLIAHARQQDTVCLMTAMMAQPLKSEFSALALARINEHHNTYGDKINSDTVLWLSWMWMDGPVCWINRAGWRRLEPFEIHAMWIFWRELSVLIGCKYVPTYLHELEHFREEYARAEQKPSVENTTYSDAIMDDILFIAPDMIKPALKKCVIAILDPDVVWANRYEKEFSPILRRILLTLLKAFGLFQRYFCLPRWWRCMLSPAELNRRGLVNFPDYTFPSTPFYVAPTFWNQWGPLALTSRLRGKPLPHARFGGNGVLWESMGAKLRDPAQQSKSEARVRKEAQDLISHPWGYRANVKFQRRSIITDKHWGKGYGSRQNAYTDEELVVKDRRYRK